MLASMPLRVKLFCAWLLAVTGVPGLLAAAAQVTGSPEWAAWLPLPGLALAVGSVLALERPRSLSLQAYLQQLRRRAHPEALGARS